MSYSPLVCAISMTGDNEDTGDIGMDYIRCADLRSLHVEHLHEDSALKTTYGNQFKQFESAIDLILWFT